jgi:hypothetical protein
MHGPSAAQPAQQNVSPMWKTGWPTIGWSQVAQVKVYSVGIGFLAWWDRARPGVLRARPSADGTNAMVAILGRPPEGAGERP